MPSRIIREGLLDSERYWCCTIEARELYRHLQLLADDLGCVSLAPVLIRRRCFDTAPSQVKIDGFLGQLVDHDLIRIYDHEGARYAFLPRFGQRLRRMHLKHPSPPKQLLQGDEDAIEKFSKIKGNVVKLSDTSLSDDGHMTAEGKRREEKRREEAVGISKSPVDNSRNVNPIFKSFPQPQDTSPDIERNRQIAEAVRDGDLDTAKRLRDEK